MYVQRVRVGYEEVFNEVTGLGKRGGSANAPVPPTTLWERNASLRTRAVCNVLLRME